MDSLDKYLRSTRLCDFDHVPEIKSIAGRLTDGLSDRRQIFNRIYQFVKELPYGLENWEVKASETLRKGWGMCSGKTNLLVAMSRSLGIPVRYKIHKIRTEEALWKWIAKQDINLAHQLGEPLSEQDHITVEVYLNIWETYDPSRDPAFEQGLKILGIPLERHPVIDAAGRPKCIILASIDQWAQNRQRARHFRRKRELVFSRVNEQLDKIRDIGRR